MGRFIDLTGKQFGRLTVLERATGGGYVKWRCRCSCGNEVVVHGTSLKSGDTRSCGCLKGELTSVRKTVHGDTGSRLYRIWICMKKRCFNPNAHSYKMYGGRGITVCDEWRNNYASFRDWALANGYSEDLSIDRIDNNGNYEPKNCRWATIAQQDNNRRNNRFIPFYGEIYTVSEWARILGMNKGTLLDRLNGSKSIEDAFLKPVRHLNRTAKRREIA